jgi:O-antigen/teichoic acid export membrane protein
MSRTRRLISGVVTHYAGQVAITLVGLWITPCILYRIGQHDYGLWLVGLQLLTYLMLCDLGIVAVAPRSVAAATGKAEGSVVHLLGQTARVVLWQMPLVASVAAALWWTLPAEWQDLRQPMGLVLLTYVLLFPLRLFQAVIEGLQDLAFLAAARTTAWFVSTAVSVGLILAGSGLASLAWSWVASQAVLHLVCGWRLWRRYRHLLPRRFGAPDWPLIRTQMGEGFWASLNQVAVVLLNATDVYLIGLLLGPAAVVPYACTAKLILVLGNHAQSVLHLSLPALAEVRASQSSDKVLAVCTSLTQSVLLMCGAVCALVLAVNQGFVTWWIGADQFGGRALTWLLLGLLVLRQWNLTMVFSIFSFGYNRRIPITTILDGLVTFGAMALLIRQVGLVGAPLGSLLGVCLVSVPANLWALAKAVEMSPWRVLAGLWPWVWRMALLVPALVVLSLVWVPTGFLTLAVTSAAVVGGYFLLMVSILMRPPLGPRLRPVWESLVARLRPTPRAVGQAFQPDVQTSGWKA